MKKVLAFAGSTSTTPINKRLATFAASQLKNTTFEVLDLNDFSLPIYSNEEEQKEFPEAIIRFNKIMENLMLKG